MQLRPSFLIILRPLVNTGPLHVQVKRVNQLDVGILVFDPQRLTQFLATVISGGIVQYTAKQTLAGKIKCRQTKLTETSSLYEKMQTTCLLI